jgi:hypothetical protein
MSSRNSTPEGARPADTGRLKTILRLVRQRELERQPPPSIREIARQLSVSVGTVTAAIRELEAAGKLARNPGVARSLRTVRSVRKSAEERARRVPILGLPRPGVPFWRQEPAGHLRLDQKLVGGRATLAAVRLPGRTAGFGEVYLVVERLRPEKHQPALFLAGSEAVGGSLYTAGHLRRIIHLLDGESTVLADSSPLLALGRVVALLLAGAARSGRD